MLHAGAVDGPSLGPVHTVQLQPGQDEKAAAKRATLRRYREEHGDGMSDFHNKRLNYTNAGIA